MPEQTFDLPVGMQKKPVGLEPLSLIDSIRPSFATAANFQPAPAPAQNQSDTTVVPAPIATSGQGDSAVVPTPKPAKGQTDSAAVSASTVPKEATPPAEVKPPVPAPQSQSYLEKGVDFLTSGIIKNTDLRHTVDHYSSEFLQTASLFTGGKVGLAATILTYGLGQASPDTTDSWKNRAEDFALGASKGVAMKGLFSVVGNHIALAPAKGVAMGLGSRTLDTVLRRQTFTDPSDTLSELKKENLNPQTWLYDAAVWTAGEAVMGGTNALTGNALNRSPIGSGMLAGSTFGAVSGGAGEIMREKAAGEKVDWSKVAEQGALEAAINGAAAGVGGSVTMAMNRSSVNVTETKAETNAKSSRAKPLSMMNIAARDAIAPLADDGVAPDQREFVITSGKDDLTKFQSFKADSAEVKVREVTHNADGTDELGDEKSLFVQQFAGKDAKLLPAAQSADIIATCHPDQLSTAERANHAFPDAKGHVWVVSGDGDKLLLSASESPIVKVSKLNDFNNATRLDFSDTTINVMAPLMVGDPKNIDGKESAAQWAEFDRQLGEAKKLGVDAVSTDVWWGLIEPTKGQFDWSYYDKISDHIINAGMQWVPILSFHQAGGNVGDDFTSKLPDHVWDTLAAKTGEPVDNFKFKSEQGHTSSEYISYYRDNAAQELYGNVMSNFRDHFAPKAAKVQEINVSLGPAGELRYPSYNSHDQNTGYPTRGALQMYSAPAIDALRSNVLQKYNGIEGVRTAWNIPDLQVDQINPPDNVQQFFDRGDHFNTQYGRDLFDVYNQTLIDHGRATLGTALKEFGAPGSAFGDTDIGAKIAGVHWRVGENENGHVILSDRLAELSAGLIRTSSHDWDSDADGRGYRPLLSMLHDIQPVRTNGHGNRVVPFFTCIEIPDGDNGPAVHSLAHTLASWFGMEAAHDGLFAKSENALAGNLSNPSAWDNIKALMEGTGSSTGYYHGVTFLRMGDIVNNDTARAKMAELMHAVSSMRSQAQGGTKPNAA